MFQLLHCKFEINQLSRASGVEVTHMLETRKACGLNPVGTFFDNLKFSAFLDYPQSV